MKLRNVPPFIGQNVILGGPTNRLSIRQLISYDIYADAGWGEKW